MLRPASTAEPPQRSGDYNTPVAPATHNILRIPVTTQHVRYVRLPCKRVPGPPIVTSPSTAAAARTTTPTAPLSSPEALNARITCYNTGPAEPLSSPVAAALAASSSAAPRSQRKTETPFQAAHQFFASSGASLLNLANSSLHLSVRNTLDGSHMDTNSGVEELSVAAHENLLTSSPAVAALKERFNSSANATYNSTKAGSGTDNGNSSRTSNTSNKYDAVDWKKFVYVRQQCRYTGEAFVTPLTHSASDLTANGRETRAAIQAAVAAAAPPTGTEADKPVGARFMQTLLQPFAPSVTASLTTAVQAEPEEEKNSFLRLKDNTMIVPHGEGVMTYVLYAMPKPNHNLPSPPPAPFLPSGLIPTAYCPSLSELEKYECPTTSPTSTDSTQASRLLLLSLVVYEGNFVHGRRHGRGRLTAYGRFVLECTWVHDVPCLSIPRPLVFPTSTSLAPTENSVPPPTLRRISAHVCNFEPAHTTTAAGPTSPQTTPIAWSLHANQVYMGSLALTTLATRRVLSKLESLWSASGASSTPVSPALIEAHGARYVQLTVPSPVYSQYSLSTWESTTSATAAAAAAEVEGSDAFSGLTWVNHVVLLPTGFGEARYYDDSDSREVNTPATLSFFVSGSFFSPFHPLLWVPESRLNLLRRRQNTYHLRGPTLTSSLCMQYCGEWAAGLPHGFGVEWTRVIDPTCTPLSLSAATAGAGPPQYPWRTLFLGQYVRGKRCGPGTHHGPQGSEATEVVVCGSWPRTDVLNEGAVAVDSQETVNVVLLPPSAGCGRVLGAPTPSFFTLQGTQWAENDRSGGDADGESGSSSCGGTFPFATLRQSPTALSGMWEPLFGAVDAHARQPADSPLQFLVSAAADGPAGDSSKSLTWRHARRVMDHLIQSPECVTALQTFQACFACIYGYDTPAAGVEDLAGFPCGNEFDDQHSSTSRSSCSSGTNASKGKTKASGSNTSINDLLVHLVKGISATSANMTAGVPVGYPWCPLHSWCGMAHLFCAENSRFASCPISARTPTPQQGSYAGCLHEPLSNGATHQQAPAPTTHGSSISKGKHVNSGAIPQRQVQRPQLSAAATALVPYAAAHTFTHAMHAAAAMVSSLRLRLLSCFAAYPNLCEIVMVHNTHDDGILSYCWDVVYQYVGPILQEKATAVAAADMHLVWNLLELDRVWLNEEDEGANGMDAKGCFDQAVAVRPGWQPEGKETLRDYLVALRRCRALTSADVVEASFPISDNEDWQCTEVARMQRCIASLEACFCTQSRALNSKTGSCKWSLEAAIDALQDVYCLLYDTTEETNTNRKDETGSATTQAASMAIAEQQQRVTMAQREAVLRWLLLAASDPTSHPSSILIGSGLCEAKPVGHPFALLLIAAFVLGGRVTPQYPVLQRYPSNNNNRLHTVTASRLLCVVKDMGYAARQLLHTYPSVRAQTLATPLAYPLDVLCLRLEYVLTPCAANYLLSSSSLKRLITASQPSPAEANGQTTAAAADTSNSANDSIVTIQLDRLPIEVLQWCNENLTDSVNENLLKTRLRCYWGGRIPALKTLSTTFSNEQSNTVGAPSPLMCWVVGCLRGLLSTSVRQPVQQDASSPPPPPAPSGPPSPASLSETHNVHTWKKFTNAVFFTTEEKRECAAVAQADYVYLVALAYTLRELAGLDLSFNAQLVFQGDEAEEDEEAAEWTVVVTEHKGTKSEGAQRRRGSPQVHSTGSLRDRRKNIFLSSSSSSSDSQVTFSPVSSPPPDATEERHFNEESGTPEATFAHAPYTPVEFAAFAGTPSPQPPQSESSVPATALTSPREGHGQRQRVLQGPDAVFTEGATSSAMVPLGKEWTLTVRNVRQDEGGCVAESQGDLTAATAVGGPTHHLISEAMEHVCSLVKLRTQERKGATTAAESDSRLLKARRR